MATRMQQRRGTAAQWTSADPILAAGEIGFESDTIKFKIGNGVDHWSDLNYFVDGATLVDGAPGLLDTLNELAAAIGDDPAFFATVASDVSAVQSTLSTHETDSTNVHGITNTADLATKSYADTAVSTHNSDTTNIHGISDTADLVYDADLDAHTNSTTSVHGINNTADLATQTYVTNAISDHHLETENIHGITNTADLAVHSDLSTLESNLESYTTDAVADHEADTMDVHGIADTAALATKIYADGKASDAETAATNAAASALSSHNSDTTDVHGISDTSLLARTDGAVFTGYVTVPQTPVLNGHAASKRYVDQVASGINFHQPVVAATTAAITLSGTQTIDGVSLSVGDRVLVKNQASLPDNGIYVVASGSWTRAEDADGNPEGELDTGDFVFVLNGTYNKGFGFVLSSPGPIEVGTSNVNYVPFNSTVTVEPGYGLEETVPGELAVDGSVIAPLANPTFTGTVTLPNSTVSEAVIANDAVTTSKILDSAVTTDKINDSAVTTGKINGGAVTEDKIANGSVTTDKINNLAVTTGKINDSAVTTDKVHDLAITTAKLDALSVTTGKITDSAVTTDKINDSAVTTAKVNDLAITTAKIDDGAVTSAKIADGAIVDADINATAAIAQSKISGLTTDLGLKAPKADPTFTGTATANNLTATGTVTVSSSGIVFTDGTQTKEGVPSRTPIVSKTVSYTLSALTERDSLIEVNSSSATTVTIPTDASVAFPVGTSLDILQVGTGQVTIAGASGVTVNATPGLKLRTQWSGATLFKRASNTWVVYGDLSA